MKRKNEQCVFERTQLSIRSMSVRQAVSLSYARAPIRRDGKEPFRIVREDGPEKFVVFSRSVLVDEMFVYSLVIASGALGFIVWNWHVSQVPRCFGGLPYLVLASFFVRHRFERASEQVELEVTDDELIRTIFGPRGRRQQHWPRSGIRNLFTEPARITLITTTGRPEIAFGSRAVCKELDACLREKLAIPQCRPTVQDPFDDLLKYAARRTQKALERLSFVPLLRAVIGSCERQEDGSQASAGRGRSSA